jgi:hypothetical protein
VLRSQVSRLVMVDTGPRHFDGISYMYSRCHRAYGYEVVSNLCNIGIVETLAYGLDTI